jgi:beta-lactamase regulating signal transducer with metallopeptidase domain
MGIDNAPFWWLYGGLRLAGGLADWLLTYAIHSTLLIGGTWLFLSTPAGRRLAPASAAWLWRFALVGAVISSLLQSLRSPEPLAGTVRVPGAPEVAAVRVAVQRVTPGSTEQAELPAAFAGPRILSWRSSNAAGDVVTGMLNVGPRWPFALLGLWLAGAVVGLLLFVRALRRFTRLLGNRRRGERTLAGGALRAVRAGARLTRPVRLTLSEDLTSPVAIGASEICLPERTLAELDPIRMESILAHELAHLERGDPRWLTLARVIEAVFFFQPLNRVARARMQEAAEFASDEWAARVVPRPLDLAHCLARVAEWSEGSSRLLAPAMAEHRGTVLVRRVRRLTAPTSEPAWGSHRGVRLAAAVMVVALVVVAPRAAIGSPPARGLGAGVFMLQMDSLATVRFRQSPGPAASRFGRVEDLRIRLRRSATGDSAVRTFEILRRG